MTTTDEERRAAELHRRAIVIDGHSDILMPITDGKMRLADRVEVPDPATWEPPEGLVLAFLNGAYDICGAFFGHPFECGQILCGKFVEVCEILHQACLDELVNQCGSEIFDVHLVSAGKVFQTFP